MKIILVFSCFVQKRYLNVKRLFALRGVVVLLLQLLVGILLVCIEYKEHVFIRLGIRLGLLRLRSVRLLQLYLFLFQVTFLLILIPIAVQRQVVE